MDELKKSTGSEAQIGEIIEVRDYLINVDWDIKL